MDSRFSTHAGLCEQPLGHPLYENPQSVSNADYRAFESAESDRSSGSCRSPPGRRTTSPVDFFGRRVRIEPGVDPLGAHPQLTPTAHAGRAQPSRSDFPIVEHGRRQAIQWESGGRVARGGSLKPLANGKLPSRRRRISRNTRACNGKFGAVGRPPISPRPSKPRCARMPRPSATAPSLRSSNDCRPFEPKCCGPVPMGLPCSIRRASRRVTPR
jgi:hypothetical protein